MRQIAFALTLGTVFTITACGDQGGGGGGPSGELHPWAQQARNEIPDALTLHTRVIQRSCGPNQGVCHNTKEYPDLHTAGNFITAVSRPCNQDLASEPESVFDGCEPKADVIESGSFRAQIGFMGFDVYDPQTGNVYRPIRLSKAPEEDIVGADARFERDGNLLVDADDVLYVEAGSTEGRLMNLYNLEYPDYLALSTVVGGDPNGNGVFGADDGWAEVMPGRPEKSYLWARITGTVPGTRMPLANAPITNVEYVAIACWIETIGSNPRIEQTIDYDDCWYAYDPTDYEIAAE